MGIRQRKATVLNKNYNTKHFKIRKRIKF